MKNLFPIILVTLDICACGVYLYNKDYARAMYWFSAGSITFSTILIK